MKKQITIELIITLLLFIAGGKSNSAIGQVVGVWTGTVTMVETGVGPLGTYERTIRTIFTNNEGSGTVIENSEFIINGQKMCTGVCATSGIATFHEISFDRENNTYRIHAISPPYSCTYSGKNCEFPTGNKNEIDLIVSDKEIINENRLEGSETKEVDIGISTKVTITIRWSLARTMDLTLIVTPEEYDTWLPEPGKDELRKGKVMNIGLQLYGRSGQPPMVKAKEFQLTLSNTSREPGITINFPLNPSTASLPDLRFLQHRLAESNTDDQTITINSSDGVTGKAYIGSYDGGGWSTLTAEAILEDNSRIKGQLLISGGPEEIPIPKRAMDSKIATAWLNANNDPTEDDDKENSAGNNNRGDGLTAYEEYRGVISKEEFKRLDPDEKELGVRGKRADLILFDEGITWFENASGLKAIRFYENEISSDRRLNKNFLSSHVYDQHVLHIEKKSIRPDVMGRVEPNPGIPKSVTRVKIDHDQIFRFQLRLELFASSQNTTLPFTIDELIAKTVAHELAHGVGVEHHGNDEIVTLNLLVNANNPVRIYNTRGSSEITERPYRIKGTVGKVGNQESGDVFCIMNYNPCYDWALEENRGWYFFYLVPMLPAGKIFCNDSTGTDINATDHYFSNARVGNCLKHIKLRD